MPTLDLKDFIWQHKETKETAIILAITDYKTDDVVVYRNRDRNKLFIHSMSDFMANFEATYQISLPEDNS